MRADTTTFRATQYLPQAVVATVVVALLPVAIVWGLRADGTLSSPWLCVGVTVVLSIAASRAGNAYWRRRPGSGDILFSELLFWGWLRRLRVERKLDKATQELGIAVCGHRPDPDPRADARRLALLNQISDAMEAHDPFIDGHSRRVARHATMVARKLGLSPTEVDKVASAATVHDIGKLLLPRGILMKPGALTDEEFEIIKQHSTEGARMVDCLGDPELTAIVRHHHERLDGTGYPSGLLGAQIPLGARIIAVADTFDAITSARPYRPAARHQQAIDILEREAGKQLDADAVRAFVSYYSESRALALWAVIAAVPHRAIAWVTRSGGGPSSVASAPAAATATATIAISAAAVIAPIATLHSRPVAVRTHRTPAAQLVAAAPGVSAVPVRASGPRHPGHRGRLATHLAGLGNAPMLAAAPRGFGQRISVAPSRVLSAAAGPSSASQSQLTLPQPTIRGSGASTPPSPVAATSTAPSTVAVASTPAPITVAATSPPAPVIPAPPATTGGSPPSGSTTGTGGGTGTGGSSGTGGETGTGGGSGSGDGGSGSGSGTGGGSGDGDGPGSKPTSPSQCLDDKWIPFGFKSEVQCLAYFDLRPPRRP